MAYITIGTILPAADRRTVSKAVRLAHVSEKRLRRLRPTANLMAKTGNVLVIEIKPNVSQTALVAAVKAIHKAISPTGPPKQNGIAWRVWARHDFGGQSFDQIAGWANETTGLHGRTAASKKVEAIRMYRRVVAYIDADPDGLAHILANQYAALYIKGSCR